MGLFEILVLSAAVTFATSGQLLLKTGMNRVGELTLTDGIWPVIVSVASTWQVVVGFALFGASSVFWLIALSRLPLSTAYPVVAMSYVLILLFSVVVLKEQPSAVVWTGALLVMSGVALIGIGQR